MQKFHVLIITVCFPFFLAAQAINTEFGKNRVQYHDNFDAWWKYETQNFITYWYGKGRYVAQSVIQLSELDHDEIQKILEHSINDKIEIIVYTDLSDLKQNNIGIEDAFTNQPKKTKVVGNKIFVHFDGNHLTLRKQIRKGIANVYLNAILLGSNFQELVQNAILLDLPPWFTEGLISYAGSYWDHEIDDEFRDILQKNPKFYNFEKLAKNHPRVAGHAFWFYIDQMYGKSTITNVIYLTRINRQVENSFNYILGISFNEVVFNWTGFFKDHYASEEGMFVDNEKHIIDLKNKPYVPVSQFRLNPTGEYLAYSYNDLGKYKVVIKNLVKDKERVILKKGTKNIFQETDYNYPLICWHPSLPQLSILYEHKDVIKLRRIDLETMDFEEQSIPENFQRIHSIDYINDDDYVFAAVTDGYSDIYVYRSDSRGHTQITEDFYDDIDASYVEYKGEKGVLFSSNRTDTDVSIRALDTILPIQNFDIFFLKIGKKKDHVLTQITKTPDYSEMSPLVYKDNDIVFLSSKSGITNRYIHRFDDGVSIPNSNKPRNIIHHHLVPNSDRYFFTYYHLGKYKTYQETLNKSESTAPKLTSYQKEKVNAKGEILTIFKDENPDSTKQIKINEGALFQTKFDDPEDIAPISKKVSYSESTNVFEKYYKDYFSENVQDGKRVIKYNPVRASASRRTFKILSSGIKLDNNPLFEGLDSYIGVQQQLTANPVGILLKAELADLHEDYRITGGARYPVAFNGSEYFLFIDRRKKLIDNRISFYRKTTTQNDRPDISQFQKSRKSAWQAQYRLSYPFNVYRSVRLTTTLRFDRYFNQSTNDLTFNSPPVNEKRISVRAEYIFDNSFNAFLNIKNGTRYKIYAEALNQFNMEFGANSAFDASTAFTTILGVDARHYIPVMRYGVLALRSAAGTSFGSKRMLYYVGGVENWIGSKFDETTPLPESNEFAYRVLAPNIRGFSHNIRNGSNYFLSSAEMRLPVFQLLGAKNMRFSFLKNLQVVGFFDAGMAWFGWSPYGEENQLNSVVLESPPVITVNVEYFRDPLVYGYGVGMRTTLLGYFLKFDYAWGVETRSVLKPRFYFSLGFDF